MAFEIQMLAVMTIIFLFAWLPTSVGKLKSYGGKWVASNRDPLAGKELLPWAARCERAYTNLQANFPAFAVAILMLAQLNKFDECTRWAAGLYVAGRVLHYLFYGLGNVQLRFVTFLVAVSCNTYLLIKVFI